MIDFIIWRKNNTYEIGIITRILNLSIVYTVLKTNSYYMIEGQESSFLIDSIFSEKIIITKNKIFELLYC